MTLSHTVTVVVYGRGFELGEYLALEGPSCDGSEPWSPGGNSADHGSGGRPWLAVSSVCVTHHCREELPTLFTATAEALARGTFLDSALYTLSLG